MDKGEIASITAYAEGLKQDSIKRREKRMMRDRHNGFVYLTDDGKGNPYVTDFPRSYDTGTEAGNAMKFSGAFLVLANRLFPLNQPGDQIVGGNSTKGGGGGC